VKPREKLRRATDLIKSGDKARARDLLVDLLKGDPANDAAWVWMATVVETDELRQKCLNEALKHNPRNKIAKRALQQMQAQGRTWMTSSPRGRVEKAGVRPLGVIVIALVLVFGVACVAVALTDLVPQAGSEITIGPLFWIGLVPGVSLILLAVMLIIGTVSLVKNPPSREEIKKWEAQQKETRRALRRSIYPFGGVIGGALWGVFTGGGEED
jgi:hypothetical protein